MAQLRIFQPKATELGTESKASTESAETQEPVEHTEEASSFRVFHGPKLGGFI